MPIDRRMLYPYMSSDDSLAEELKFVEPLGSDMHRTVSYVEKQDRDEKAKLERLSECFNEATATLNS